MKALILEIQQLRGLAFLAVVLQHTLGAFIRQSNVTMGDVVLLSLLYQLCKFAVPAFILITGFVLFYNYHERLHYPSFIRKRLLEIGVPYFLWAIVYYGRFAPETPDLWTGFMEFGFQTLSGWVCYHLWFVIMILQYYLLFPVFRHLYLWGKPYLQTKRQVVLAYGGLLLLYLALGWFYVYQLPGFDAALDYPLIRQAFVDFRDRNFIFWFFYFALGALAGLQVTQWRAWVAQVQIKNGFVWIGFLSYVFFFFIDTVQMGADGITVDMDAASLFKPSVIALVLSSLVLIYGLSLWLVDKGGWMARLNGLLGQHSYFGYLAHALVLDYTADAVRKAWPVLNPSMMMLATSLICVMVCLLLSIVISYLPFGRYLGGSRGNPLLGWNEIPRTDATLTVSMGVPQTKGG
ncbi:acyltransferase [Heliophilum fasciatum]|uniref:Surface polysaccharide O-acyltransferase-like enzyme n=1 Tax=Heliophilum fasciatum TaxID=35700 RepID=A0A4R2RVF0_9FIRM|nr:acyltransferase [Heliophilum fasciatum]MCW2278288.1 surface polysaccharide O-acyltransferase-like enzyme [Heliophilum fasciatum]TCP63911.1 surface polysaccharide O-acyltransferase-like enzyme [Heliophilum fasciatum]